MMLPEHENPSPIPAFMQELAAFFQQQAQEAEETLHQNDALHKALAYLEHAVVSIQKDQPEESEAALLTFSAQEEPRRREQARLFSILGRQERSPHAERQEALVSQLTEALQQKKNGEMHAQE